MSTRSGIAELRREFERLSGGVGGVVGLGERMRAMRVDRLDLGFPLSPPTREECKETMRTSPPDSLRHKMAERRLYRMNINQGIEQ